MLIAKDGEGDIICWALIFILPIPSADARSQCGSTNPQILEGAQLAKPLQHTQYLTAL